MIQFDYSSVPDLPYSVLSTEQGKKHTYLLARHALNVSGAFVECGVAYGGAAAIMLRAARDAGQSRELHLFDSFEGIPLAGPRDCSQPGLSDFIADRNLPIEQRLKSSGIAGCSVEEVQNNFRRWDCPLDRVHFHAGWFQQTMPNVHTGPIAMLRLDGDLYESTLCCLQGLYDDVVSGGVVLVDDFRLAGARDAVLDYFSAHALTLPEMPVTVDTGACYWIKL